MAKSKGKKIKRLPGPPLAKSKPINPFNLHQNRKKFSVLGQKVKGTKGLPGVSRQRAFENRSKTLLVEYLNRNKANTFIDRRLGENNKDADQGIKDDLRRVEQLRRTSTKHTLYNLSDEPEILTHAGVPITEETLKAHDYDDDLHEDGMLDAQFVKKQHFGGASLYADADVPPEERKYKSQKDKIDEIVAESKMRKLQAKQDQESQRKKVDVLDSQFKDFMEMMRGNLITHEDKKKAKRADALRDYDRLMRDIAADGGPRACPAERLKTDEEIAKEKKEELERLEADRLRRMRGEHEDEGPKVFTRSADSLDSCLMKQFDERPMMAYKDGELIVLNAEGKPVAMDGTKPAKKLTKEERRKRRKQQKMEKKLRLEEKKLLDDYLPSDYEEDDSSDGGDFSDDSDGGKEVDDGKNEIDDDDDAEEEVVDDEEDQEEEEKGSDADDSQGDDEEESDEEDKYSDILEEEEEEEAEISDADEEKENEIVVDKRKRRDAPNGTISDPAEIAKNNKLSKKDSKRKKVSFSIDTEEESEEKRTRRLQEEASKELPYTLEVPADYTQFWESVQGRCPEEVATMVDRMVATNHPQLQHANILKCSQLFTYVLQFLHGLCTAEGVSPLPSAAPIAYLDPLTPQLFSLARLAPVECARAFLLVFIEKRDEYRKRVKKRYPNLDTLVFLQLAGVLYPASDFYHPVMSPVKLYLAQLLGEAKMKEPRDVLAALYCATLLLEYTQETKRFCPELLSRLLGLVLCCTPADAQDAEVSRQNERSKAQRSERERVCESHVPLQWLVHPTLPHPDMLPLTTVTKITSTPPKFQLSMLNDQNLLLSDQFRCTVLLTCLKLLRDLCRAWSELPSVREAFSPLHALLPLIPAHLYPDEVLQAKEDLQKTLEGLPQHPSRMRINRGRPKPLRMYEPLVVAVKADTSRKAFNKSGQRALKQKLLHCVKKERKAATREIKKDNMFLAHQKLQETLASDAERRRKVGIIYREGAIIQGEYNKYMKTKSRK